ncbi:VWD domain-containing protein [Nocardia sp. NBC_01377]|uniref:VWD domain-containing protein n=1 Tax=Nocardia sp. NBC_01377 TaxID=2903595 RepID=UPI0038631106
MPRWTIASIVAVIVAALIAAAPPASATITVDSGLQSLYNGCVDKIRSAGPGADPGLGAIIDDLQRSGTRVLVRAPFIERFGSFTDLHPWRPGRDVEINWVPGKHGELYPGENVRRDRCAELIHEMAHAKDAADKIDRGTRCRVRNTSYGASPDEVHAVGVENDYRRATGLPQRTSYSGNSIPPDGQECDLPKGPPPGGGGCSATGVGVPGLVATRPGAACSTSNGDPHLWTFDGTPYDFQAVGEFVLASSTPGDLEVQVRQTAFPGSSVVSVNTAAAMNVAGDTVGIYLTADGMTLRINGTQTPVTEKQIALGRGGAVAGRGDGVTVRWPDGSTFDADPIGPWGLRLAVGALPERRTTMTGLLGDYNGDPKDDLAVRGGRTLQTPPPFEALYPEFADSWRVEQSRSLFDYGPGEDTATFTDRHKPTRAIDATGLPNRATAELICRRSGITDPRILANCILDVALTGQPAFAEDAAQSQAALTIDGDLLLEVRTPATAAEVTVPGIAGQRLFVRITGSDLPDQCAVVTLLDPQRQPLGSGCVITGSGFIDTVTLPVTGQYTLRLAPAENATGRATLRINTATDHTAAITIDGTADTATVGQPGAVSTLGFDAVAGQKIFIEATEATLPDECNVLSLRDPDGQFLAGGCVIGGKGYVDGTVLPRAGRYTVLVDPHGDTSGQTRIRVHAATDQQLTATVGGSGVAVVVDRPGAVSRLSFDATAGQRLTIESTDSTFPDQCNLLTLRDPRDQFIGAACSIDGTITFETAALPNSGRYTLLVDPAATDTGTATLRIRN